LVQINSDEQLNEHARASPPIGEIAPFVRAFAGEVYLVGGAVRDLILGREIVDVDLAVDGDAARLASELGTPRASQTRFGTITVERNGYHYDLARTRREAYPHPGALPEVEPAGIAADLGRRDFTVNALALALSCPRAAELLAAPGALEDLEARQLAVLHDRSFLDDPTRLLRLARYAARLGFAPSPHTRELAAQAIAGGALGTISGTRIGNELRLLANERDPVAAFEAAAELGLPWRIDAQLARGALRVLPTDGRADLLVLGCALNAEELDDLGFTAGDRDTIAEAATRSRGLAERLAETGSRSEIARTVGSFGIETVALASSQGAPSQSQTWLQDLRHQTLDITGQDLIERGIRQGPSIGQALQAATDALMDGTAADRESQLQVALRAAE
jgi:tRNA nucleotidyltransferase (CCA-adding enzyme)